MDVEDKEIKNSYEITFLTKEESAGPVLKILEANSALVEDEKPIQKVQLEYKIKGFDQAYIGIIKFSSLPEAVSKITDSANLDGDILRFIVTRPIRKSEKERVPGAAYKSDGEGRSMPDKKKRDDDFLTLTNAALQEKIEEILK